MMKTFVLDTNVLLHSVAALDAFADNRVGIPLSVIEELDGFKKKSDELARNARAVTRRLDAFRRLANQRAAPDGKRATLLQGVANDAAAGGPGVVQVYNGDDFDPVPGLRENNADNDILRVACGLMRRGERVVMVSKDMNLRIKADTLGLEAQDFEAGKVNFDELYSGMRAGDADPRRLSAFQGGDDDFSDLFADLFPNEGVFFRNIPQNKTRWDNVARADARGRLRPLDVKNCDAGGVKPRSPEQRMALELLLDPEVALVTLVGGAGTGKTLLALAAGLEWVQRGGRYERVLVSRPIMPLGKDIGFLPGGKDDKLGHWMQPIYDNLGFIASQGEKARGGGKAVDARVAELMRQGAVELEAIAYIRGRSIPGTYIIVDEAQNLTPHEVKTVVSRAGHGTKVVLTGDPEQIDNPYLDSASNGLSHAVERMKGLPLAGHVTLHRSERSPLAAAAAERL